MKCNQSRPGFELVSSCPFPTAIIITPRTLYAIIDQKLIKGKYSIIRILKLSLRRSYNHLNVLKCWHHSIITTVIFLFLKNLWTRYQKEKIICKFVVICFHSHNKKLDLHDIDPLSRPMKFLFLRSIHRWLRVFSEIQYDFSITGSSITCAQKLLSLFPVCLSFFPTIYIINIVS